MSKTTYGTGTVFQRSSDRRWIAAIEVREPRAPRRRKTFSDTTREGAQAKLAAWREANGIAPRPESLGRAENLRRARELGTHTEREFWAKVRAADRLCEYCGHEIGLWDFHGDHIIPISRGGSDAIDNIAVCCKACNMAKGTMTGDEFRAWKAGR